MTLLDRALDWFDPWFDPDAGLLWNPPGSFPEVGPPRTVHLVPQSAWHALGLLARSRGDDVGRAHAILGALAALQYDCPGTPWHGSFSRFLETPEPGPGAVEWIDYDPNWRQFLGTAFALAVDDRVGLDVDAALAARLRTAIDGCVGGEPDDRVPPTYSNIAIMRSWLAVEYGDRAEGEAFAGRVAAAFDRHGAFDEYGSPTYYGIDLFGLALWRRSTSDLLRSLGDRIEAGLWQDIARWYHGGLRELCGPYSRAYGMSCGDHLALLGLTIGAAVPPELAPLPDLGAPFEHSHDVSFAALPHLLTPAVPDDVVAHLSAFTEARTLEQHLGGGRVATGWLDDVIALGAERGGPFPPRGQYHPMTAHLLAADTRRTGWVRPRHPARVEATVTPGRLDATFAGSGPCTLVVAGLAVDDSGCRLHGRDHTIAVETDGRWIALDGGDLDQVTKVRFDDVRRLALVVSER